MLAFGGVLPPSGKSKIAGWNVSIFKEGNAYSKGPFSSQLFCKSVVLHGKFMAWEMVYDMNDSSFFGGEELTMDPIKILKSDDSSLEKNLELSVWVSRSHF